MRQVAEQGATLSEKIRLLYDASVPPADIARFLDRRYQHVYNVIKDHKRKIAARPVGEARQAAPEASVSSPAVRLVVGRGGSLRLPAEWLDGEDLKEGDVVVCRAEARGLLIMSKAAATEMLREIALARMPGEADLLDALLGADGER